MAEEGLLLLDSEGWHELAFSQSHSFAELFQPHPHRVFPYMLPPYQTADSILARPPSVLTPSHAQQHSRVAGAAGVSVMVAEVRKCPRNWAQPAEKDGFSPPFHPGNFWDKHAYLEWKKRIVVCKWVYYVNLHIHIVCGFNWCIRNNVTYQMFVQITLNLGIPSVLLFSGLFPSFTHWALSVTPLQQHWQR